MKAGFRDMPFWIRTLPFWAPGVIAVMTLVSVIFFERYLMVRVARIEGQVVEIRRELDGRVQDQKDDLNDLKSRLEVLSMLNQKLKEELIRKGWID